MVIGLLTTYTIADHLNKSKKNHSHKTDDDYEYFEYMSNK